MRKCRNNRTSNNECRKLKIKELTHYAELKINVRQFSSEIKKMSNNNGDYTVNLDKFESQNSAAAAMFIMGALFALACGVIACVQAAECMKHSDCMGKVLIISFSTCAGEF